MSFHPIGLAQCSRCGGHDPNCYVCNDVKPEDEDDGPESELEYELDKADYLHDKLRDDQVEAAQTKQ